MWTGFVFFAVNVRSVYSLQTANALATSLSTSSLFNRFGYFDILYVKAFTFHLLPCSAYRFDRESDPKPILSLTPQRGSDISCMVSSSNSPDAETF